MALDEETPSDRAAPGQRAAGGQPAPAFKSIVAGVDGSRSAYEAARQAAVLAGPGCSLSLVAVAYTTGTGLDEQSLLTSRRAEESLARAAELAAEAGAPAKTELVVDPNAPEVVLDRARAADLLVTASHGGSRLGGIMLGSTASVAVHRAATSVLVARRPAGDRDFPADIVAASDGSPTARRAIELSGRIAGRYGSRVTLVHAGHEDSPTRHELASESVDLQKATGVEPVIVAEPGEPHAKVLEVAERVGASLIVLGSRGLTGLKALGSVSERVAHEARCSVLVVRPGAA